MGQPRGGGLVDGYILFARAQAGRELPETPDPRWISAYGNPVCRPRCGLAWGG